MQPLLFLMLAAALQKPCFQISFYIAPPIAFSMRIIPVLDVKGGVAVAGKSGERSKYKPLKSVFASSSNPIEIAKSIPLHELYVADLDGVMHGRPNFKLLEELSQLKKLMVDAGVRSYSDVEKISELNVDIILGSETLESAYVVQKTLENFKERVILSVDIKNEEVLSSWLPKSIPETFNHLRGIGAKRFIFLDISSVGTLKGFGFEFLNEIKPKLEIEILVGGGIRQEDLARLEKLRVSGALVGTALHGGMIKV